jgi:hypothetical protein
VTKLDAVIFVFTVGAIPCVLEAFTWLAAENRRVARAAVAATLVVVAENEQLSHRPWQSGAILVAATFFAAVSPSLRRSLLLATLAVVGPIALRPGLVGDTWRHLLVPDRVPILLVGSGFLVATIAGSTAVEQLIRWIKKLPKPATVEETIGGAPEGGRIIGILERALVFGAVLVHHPEAVGLVVAVKSIARFPELTKSSNAAFTEYFLIGTLSSILFALVTAYLVRAGLAAV